MGPIKCPKQYCGEVFITNNYLMMLECKYCTEEFVPYDEFLKHIFEMHFDDIEAYESDMEDDNDNEINIEADMALKQGEVQLEQQQKMDKLGEQQSDRETLDHRQFIERNEIEKTEQLADISTSSTIHRENKLSKRQKNVNSNQISFIINHDGETLDHRQGIERNEIEKTEQLADISTSSTIHRENKLSNRQKNSKHQVYLAAATKNVRAVCKRIPANKKQNETLERKYKCKFCDLSFDLFRNLQIHELRHTNIRPHSCTLCDKRFFTTPELTVHMRYHTGERPFVCSFCGSGFVTSGSLHVHEASHNEQKFKCEHCDKSYGSRLTLKRHSVVHTGERPYKCNICSNTFTRSTTLQNHKRLHENALRYECTICSKRFNQKAALVCHKKRSHNIVTGASDLTEGNPFLLQQNSETSTSMEKEYACDYCDSSFNNKQSLSNHQVAVHALEGEFLDVVEC